MLFGDLGEYLNPSYILIRRAVLLSVSEALLRMSTSKLEMNPKLKTHPDTVLILHIASFRKSIPTFDTQPHSPACKCVSTS